MPAPTSTSLVDRVNDADEAIGVIERGRVLEHAVGFRVVHVLVFNAAGQVLLQQVGRSRERSPLLWGSSGTLASRGTSALDAQVSFPPDARQGDPSWFTVTLTGTIRAQGTGQAALNLALNGWDTISVLTIGPAESTAAYSFQYVGSLTQAFVVNAEGRYDFSITNYFPIAAVKPGANSLSVSVDSRTFEGAFVADLDFTRSGLETTSLSSRRLSIDSASYSYDGSEFSFIVENMGPTSAHNVVATLLDASRAEVGSVVLGEVDGRMPVSVPLELPPSEEQVRLEIALRGIEPFAKGSGVAELALQHDSESHSSHVARTVLLVGGALCLLLAIVAYGLVDRRTAKGK